MTSKTTHIPEGLGGVPIGPRADMQTHDLVVLSDLHLGEGRVGNSERFSPMEDFFYDEAFARMLRHLRTAYHEDPSKLVLVLNGDVFDFLTVTCIPTRQELANLDFDISVTERRFGLNPTPKKSVWKLERILEGHPAFFQALARFVAAGHRVEVLRGNHDLELFFAGVQERLLLHLSEQPEGPSMEELQRRLHFHQWFYLEEERVYIEHGNQYEASNSIRYPLRPLLPQRKTRSEHENVLNYPLGSLFVRYFYNGVHRIDPYTPKIGSIEHYLHFLSRYNLLDLLRIARSHYPFFLRALRPQATAGTSGPTRADDAEQAQTFHNLDHDGETPELHRKLNHLKIHPMSASKLALVKEMSKPLVKRVAWTAGVTFASLYLWLLVFSLIQSTPWLAESVFAKAILLAILTVFTMIVLFGIGNYMGHKLRQAKDQTVDVCAEQAIKIATLTEVPLVLMGHTHVVDTRELAGGKTNYSNSGTWTSVDNPWDRLHPDARRFTFVLVQETKAHMVRWNDDAGRVDPIPLFALGPSKNQEPPPPLPTQN
ncbi:MAG: metallophosphoesterase [Deltaproteobacteria bacterium]|nr:metallophosphoesterase [Deltaproteobacteria bacterium]